MRIRSTGAPSRHHSRSSGSSTFDGIYIGTVKKNVDPTGLGKLHVWIPSLSGADPEQEDNWFPVRYCPPIAGGSNTAQESKANNANKFSQSGGSYGMWAVPPDLNVQVICAFVNGDTHTGIWWCCLPMDGHTHALPGVASGQTHAGQVLPVGERSRFNTTDAQSENRPKHPQGDNLIRQGLDKDLSRGHINASPFRNTGQGPGNNYGMLTPGQHKLVLDDGPYGGTGGQIRLQTAGGSSFIMDNGGQYIYAINGNGTAWFQLDAAGNIDFYAKSDFSVNAEGSINLRAANNINLDAGKNINATAAQNWNLEACEIFNATGTTGMKLSTGQSMNILADSQMKLTAAQIHLNGPAAARATLPATNSLASNTSVGKSVAGRVPEGEPYGGHSWRQGEQPTVPPGSPGVPEETIIPHPDSHEEKPAPDDTNALDCVPEPLKSKLSDEGFAILKTGEAYRGVMYSDFQGYSIGYGTRIDIFGPASAGGGQSKVDKNLQQALLDGPSESESRLVSRQIIDRDFTPRVMKVIEKTQAGRPMCLTQSIIDALIMAAYSRPVAADKMAKQVVEAAVASFPEKVPQGTIASIWANSNYNNSSNIRNSHAKYANTGKPNPDTVVKSPEKLLSEGQAHVDGQMKRNQVPVPAGNWSGTYGNGSKGGSNVQATYNAPTAVHKSQYERSTFLNTGKSPAGSSVTTAQLKDKHGEPHKDKNTPQPQAPNKSTNVDPQHTG